jgi:hypothetical protein
MPSAVSSIRKKKVTVSSLQGSLYYTRSGSMAGFLAEFDLNLEPPLEQTVGKYVIFSIFKLLSPLIFEVMFDYSSYFKK